MTEGHPFGNYVKRKYITSPKKSFYQKKRSLSTKLNDSPTTKFQTSITKYYSPVSESKRDKLNSEDTSNSKKEHIRRSLFDSKKEPIPISDDDDKTFELHIKTKQSFKPRSTNSQDSIDERLNVEFRDSCLAFFDYIDEIYEPKLGSKEEQMEKQNSEVNLEDKHSSKCNSFKTPEKIKQKSKNTEDDSNTDRDCYEDLEISPTKSVMSLEEATSLVSDVDWWEDNDLIEDFNDKIPTNPSSTTDIILQTSSGIKSGMTEPYGLNTIICNNVERNVISEFSIKTEKDEQNKLINKEFTNSEIIDNRNNKNTSWQVEEKVNSQVETPQLYYDSLYYIITTPPALLAWDTIFTHSQYKKIHSNYKLLSIEEKRLYSRLFQRKYDWIRFDNIKYDFISDVSIALTNLAKVNFVTFLNPETEDLTNLLHLMQVDELKQACNIAKLSKKGKRIDLIENILKHVKSQALLRFGNINPVNNMKVQIGKILPKLVKLEENSRQLFMSFLIISTYPQFKSRDDNRLTSLIDQLYKLNIGQLREIELPLSATQVFKSLAKFQQYEESVNLVDQLIDAKKEKKWNEAQSLILQAKTDLKLYLTNEENIFELDQMVDFMRRYTPGSNYAYAINDGIDVLKKDKTDAGISETIECIVLLLGQHYFQKGSRAKLHCELALLWERWKKFDEVYLSLKQGLEENSLSPLGRLMLAQRCEMLIKKKHGLSVPQKDDLAILSQLQPYRFTTNSISAISMPNVTTNNKQMWTKPTENGRGYMGVEEVVRQHYLQLRDDPFTEGYHDEGRIIINLALCVFWDIIYAPLNGMFHVRLQDRPLDWGSSAFYRNRTEIIKNHIDCLQNTGLNGVMEVILNVCDKHNGTISMISWELIKFERLPEIKKFLECLGILPFLKFCDYLFQAYKERSSGLPDLTLWNVKKKKCLLVEVKGPSDKLSTKQILWLHKLNEFGIEAEVCHVHTLHTGKRDLPS